MFFFLTPPRAGVSLDADWGSSRYWIWKYLKIQFCSNITKYIITISSSVGTLDKKSSNSLFGIVFGRTILLENLAMPQASRRNLIGIKCRTSVAAISSTTANQVSSGTVKLNVLQKEIVHILIK